MPSIEIRPVGSRRELRAFVRFPGRVYRGDPNWVPPLISERLEYLDPRTGPFYQRADVALLAAYRGRELMGTIGAFVDRWFLERVGRPEGGFGFFETLDDYDVAHALLDAACEWLREKGMNLVRGPTNFSDNDSPGVLVEGADCPPVMLEAHTPPYYVDYLERYGMQTADDLYAWRAQRSQIGQELEKLPPQLVRVADVARRMARVSIRPLRMDDWDQEIATAYQLFTTTLHNLSDRAPYSEPEFRRLAGQMRPFIQPDLALVAEADGKPVGFLVAVPDINRVLMRLNGRLFPFHVFRLKRYMSEIEVVTFKLMGVLEEYRRRGIDALLYLEAVKAVYARGYAWLDGSITSERNTVINMIALRLGAERYKHYRLYERAL